MSNITITAATPVKSSSADIVYLANGSLAPGSSVWVPDIVLENSDINLNDDVTGDQSQFFVRTDGAINIAADVEIDPISAILEAGTSINNQGSVIPTFLLKASARDVGIDTTGTGFFGSTIATTTGVLSLAPNASGADILANNGNLTIANLGTSKKTDRIEINFMALSAFGPAGLGNVTVSVGTPGAPLEGKTPKGDVTINETPPNQVFFGKKGVFLDDNAILTLTAKGANVVFNNPLGKTTFEFWGRQQ